MNHAETAINRVEYRVRQGGHNVPPEDIRRRYDAGIRNVFQLYEEILDAWCLYDASRLPPKLVAFEEQGLLTVIQPKRFQRIKQQAEHPDEENS